MVRLLCQINEQGRGVVFKLDYTLGDRSIFLDNTIEEGHGWTDACHLILVILVAIVSCIRRTIRIPEGVDERV